MSDFVSARDVAAHTRYSHGHVCVLAKTNKIPWHGSPGARRFVISEVEQALASMAQAAGSPAAPAQPAPVPAAASQVQVAPAPAPAAAPAAPPPAAAAGAPPAGSGQQHAAQALELAHEAEEQAADQVAEAVLALNHSRSEMIRHLGLMLIAARAGDAEMQSSGRLLAGSHTDFELAVARVQVAEARLEAASSDVNRCKLWVDLTS